MKFVTSIVCVLLTASLSGGQAVASDVRSTKHNLSVTGPGPVKAFDETRVCVFCHIPHNASPQAQLWNRNESGSSYTPYASTSLNASPDQPTGSSKLCLSCHDGTIALGDVLSEAVPITMAGGITTMPAGAGNLDIVLLDDHPISFAYTPGLAAADGQLADPGTLTGAVKLDAAGELQCMTCHNAHDDTFGKFLVMDNTGAAICQSCHQRNYWALSTHSSSGATWNSVPPDPWPHTEFTTVADNACENCHKPHSAGGAERLLNYAEEELNCLTCHNTNVAATDVDADFQKAYVHPVATTLGVHDSEEAELVATRHVECADCHNAHAVESTGALPPAVSGRLAAVPGIDTDGNIVDPANNEYEVCYRCHADSPGKPGPKTTRQVVQDNVRLEFDPGNPSFHPVESARLNPEVPSLLPPYTSSSVMYCTDCHNSNDGPRAGGSGPDGPHGSSYPGLLGWQFLTSDPAIESPAAFELCYRCHDRTSILNDESFGAHNRHLDDASCNVCHDPHGISSTQGNSINNSHLINFDLSVVTPNSKNGILEYVDTGSFSGECTLTCHKHRHNGSSY